MSSTYAGAFINPIDFGNVEYCQHALCVVDTSSAKVALFKHFQSLGLLDGYIATHSGSLGKVTRLAKDQFICPGFVDLHAHAPQIRNLGLGLDYPLLEWLEKVTFPEEVSFGRQTDESAEEHYSRIATIYRQMVRALLSYGTTTCCYFGSLQNEANTVLLDVLSESRQRALIGKVCMDCYCPPNYMESTEASLSETVSFIRMVQAKDAQMKYKGTLLPVVTPRFALCCTKQSMVGLGSIANDHQVHIQTHMSENKDEVLRAGELFPAAEDYPSIYQQCGLLTPKTILAHCIHVSDQQRDLLAKRGVGVAHCPNSNFSLSSGIMSVREMIAKGINVGLGTDISGGYGISILDAMRQAIIASKAAYFNDGKYKPLTVEEVFYMATLGGARSLQLDGCIGSFAQQKTFDALLVDLTACPVPRKDNESLQESLQRFVFTGDDRWIKAVYVNNTCI